MSKFFARLILSFFGWKAENAFPSDVKKYILIVGPHTSAWDFVVGVLFRASLRIDAKFLGKEELFKGPFGFLFRWLGGYPVDRFNKSNLVDQVVKIVKDNEAIGIALSPEGTRQRVDKLRTGFYYIALKAHVPIIMAGLDYQRRVAIFSSPFFPTGEKEQDFEIIYNFFRPVVGKIPAKGMQHF